MPGEPGDAPRDAEIARLRAEVETLAGQAAALRQMAALGQLMSAIVHEINTPLGSLFSNSEVLQRSLRHLERLLEDLEPDARKKAAEVIQVCHGLASVDRLACERISALIRALKSHARLDTEQRRPARVNDILRDSLVLAQAVFRNRIEIQTEFAELPEVECYPDQLGQVFLNILVNAAQAIEQRGRISARSRQEGEEVHVSISDSGRGMYPDEQRLVFQRGFTTKAAHGGTGWGLAIAKEIIETRHRGSISFESLPGVGTTFHIRIPVRP